MQNGVETEVSQAKQAHSMACHLRGLQVGVRKGCTKAVVGRVAEHHDYIFWQGCTLNLRSHNLSLPLSTESSEFCTNANFDVDVLQLQV